MRAVGKLNRVGVLRERVGVGRVNLQWVGEGAVEEGVDEVAPGLDRDHHARLEHPRRPQPRQPRPRWPGGRPWQVPGAAGERSVSVGG